MHREDVGFHVLSFPVIMAGIVLLAACYALALQPWLSSRIGTGPAAVLLCGVLMIASVTAMLLVPALQNWSSASPSTYLWGVGAAFVAFLGAMGAYTINSVMLELTAPESAGAMRPDSAAAGLALLLMVACAAISEELLFRGLLQNALGTVLPEWQAIVMAAAAFSAYHLNAFQLLPTLVLGLVLGFVVAKSGLSAAIVAHIVFNLLGAGMMMLSGRLS